MTLLKRLYGSISEIKNKVYVKDIMTKGVVTLDKNDSVYKGMKLMSEKYLSSVVIVQDDKPVGILTERDLLNRVFLKEKNPKKIKLSEIMTHSVKTIHPDAPILKAAGIMHAHYIKRLIVTDDEGEIIGIITQTDIIKSLNKIYTNYKSLLWNPWFLVATLALITLFFLTNFFLFGK